MLASLRTTVALVLVVILLLAVAATESWYLWLRDEPVATSARPVVTGQIAHRAAVDVAAQDLAQILSTSYRSYAGQVDQATGLMTESFGADYRRNAERNQDDFVAARTEVRSQVVAAGVMRASSAQVEALLFVNQAVTRKGADTSLSRYRVRVTMVRTDRGWKVSNIETK